MFRVMFQKNVLVNNNGRLRNVYIFILALLLFLGGYACQQDNINPHSLLLESDTLPVNLIGTYSLKHHIVALPVSNAVAVFLATDDQKIVAIAKNSVDVIWEYQVEGKWFFPNSESFMAVDESVLLLSIDGKVLIALDVLTGQEVWRSRLPLASHSRSPDILLLDDVIVIAIPMSRGGNAGYVAMYALTDGDMLAYQIAIWGNYQHITPCSPILSKTNGESNWCLMTSDKVSMFNTDNNTRLATINTKEITDIKLFAYNKPLYVDEWVLTNHFTYKVTNLNSLEQFDLLQSCDTRAFAEGAFLIEKLVLGVTGCNDIFILSVEGIEAEPSWQITVDENVISRFVSFDGKVGYVLTDGGEVLGIDLITGGLLDKLFVHNGELRKKHFENNLFADTNSMYLLLDGKHLYIWQ